MNDKTKTVSIVSVSFVKSLLRICIGRLPYMVYNWLTDPDAWFILCEDHELNMFWRRKVDMERDNDFDSENARFKATMRFIASWSIPWGLFGSPGA